MMIFAQQLLDHRDPHAFFTQDKMADRQKRQEAALALIRHALQLRISFVYREGMGENDMGTLALASGGSSVVDPRLTKLLMTDARSLVGSLIANSSDLKEIAKAIALFSVTDEEFGSGGG